MKHLRKEHILKIKRYDYAVRNTNITTTSYSEQTFPVQMIYKTPKTGTFTQDKRYD